jgi:hypothetical protein
MKKIVVALVIHAFCFSLMFAQLSGLKTVGIGGDYATLSSAIADVNTNGLNGNTIFEIIDGYDRVETDIINSYLGNELYTLTIRPEAGANQVILRVSSSILLELDSTNNIIIDGRPGGITDACALKFIHSNTGNSSTIYARNSKNTTIRNCSIRFDGSRAVDLENCDASIVEACDIATNTNGPTSNGATIGINAYRSTNTTIRNNFIHDLHVDLVISIYGINMFNPDSEISNDSIYNNVVSINTQAIDSAAQINGIYIENDGGNHYLLFNSIYIAGVTNASRYSYGLHCDGANSLLLLNNIIINKRSNGVGYGLQYGIYIASVESENINSDYNLLLCDGIGGLPGVFNVECLTLNDWQIQTGWDLHSVSKEVEFAALETSDLHLAGNSLTDIDLFGIYADGLPDIDNEVRYANTTFMGADQPSGFEDCVPGTQTDPVNIVENGDFEGCSLAPWYFFFTDAPGISATPIVYNGTCIISRFNLPADPSPWDIQLYQSFNATQVSRIEIGSKYVLSFDAWAATNNRPCRVAFQQDASPWATLLDETISINTGLTHYSFEFTPVTSYPGLALTFQPGADSSSLTIDNVRMVKIPILSAPSIDFTKGVKILPNPATDFILVEAPELSEISIYDLMGIRVKEVRMAESQVKIDVSDLSEAVYLIEIRTGNTVKVEEVILQ